ncbi:MAG TPA: hypothetical protein VMY34_10210, partial [Acidimicrobiales bacterium]|nr:hypothetical protein [Acidimicrobiales bacterium]
MTSVLGRGAAIDASVVGSASVAPAVRHDVVASRHRPPRPWIPRTILILADMMAICVAVAGGLVASTLIAGRAPTQTPAQHEALFAATLPAWLLIFGHYGLYNTRYLRSRMEEFRRIVHACAASVLATAMAGYTLERYASRGWLASTAVIAIASVTAERAAARSVFAALRRRGRMLRPVVLVGGNDEGLALCSTLVDDP